MCKLCILVLRNRRTRECTVIGTVLNYAAELEQALAATELMESVGDIAGNPWGVEAQDAVAERYGRGGMDLPFEYQNDTYWIDYEGHPAPYVVFH